MRISLNLGVEGVSNYDFFKIISGNIQFLLYGSVMSQWYVKRA